MVRIEGAERVSAAEHRNAVDSVDVEGAVPYHPDPTLGPLQQAYWAGVTARHENRAVLLIDAQAVVVRASGPALALISSNDGLKIAKQRLQCEQRSDDARLSAALAAAVRPLRPEVSAIRVQRRSGRAPLFLVVLPTSNQPGRLPSQALAALVEIIDPLAIGRPKLSLWRALFELTTREAELAELLAIGHSVESAAATLQIAVPTARTHLRSIFRKSGTDRQSSLLRLLNRVG